MYQDSKLPQMLGLTDLMLRLADVIYGSMSVGFEHVKHFNQQCHGCHCSV